MQTHLDEELAQLRRNLARMGTYAEAMIRQAVQMFTDPSEGLVQRLRDDEDAVNRLHMAIDDSCMRLLVLRQPAATDLRFITSTLKINGELERIGDQSINLMRRARTLDTHANALPRIDFSPMVRIASSMVTDALDAFSKKDVALAHKVLGDEQTADELRYQYEQTLIDTAEKKARDFPVFMQLVLVILHLERIADHATNIAEDVIYFLEGRDVRHHHLE